MDFVKFLTGVQAGDFDVPEVLKFVEENADGRDIVEDGLNELEWRLNGSESFMTIDGIPIRHEHTEGGFEGAGDTYYVVFEYGGRFYRIDGYYNSWDGSELDGVPYEVKKVPVEAFDYKPIKD